MKNACFVLMCLLCCPNGVLFDAGWKERTKVTLKVGENVTLQLPVNDNAAGEIKEVRWTKESTICLKISKDEVHFFTENYESIICSRDISWITICNATRNNTGMYTAQITYSNSKVRQDPKKETFYVAEDPYFCDGTTYRNVIEGDTVNLSIDKYPGKQSWWSKNNTNVTASEKPKLSIYDNGTLSIFNVRKEDKGSYTVTIVKENSPLYPPCTHTYILSTSPSSFCGKTTNRNETEGDNVTLPVKVCKSAESCMWSKNNINVTASENPKLSIYDNGTLSIPNLTKEDEGNYTVMNELTQCNYTYILSISSADHTDRTLSLLSDFQIGIIVLGRVAAFMIIVVIIAAIYVCRKKTRQRTTRRNPDPPREENRHHEEIPLKPNSHQNGVRENEEETSV